MWFFVEFLPEILISMKKIKHHIHNRYILLSSVIFILSITYVVNVPFKDYHYFIYMLFTIIYAVATYIIIQNIENTQKNREYLPMHFDVIFNEIVLTKKIKYKEIYQLCIDIPQHDSGTFIQLIIDASPVKISINQHKISQEKITSFQAIFKQLILSSSFFDRFKQPWKLQVKLKGLIHPLIEISLYRLHK